MNYNFVNIFIYIVYLQEFYGFFFCKLKNQLNALVYRARIPIKKKEGFDAPVNFIDVIENRIFII